MSARSLIFDLKLFSADTRLRTNLLAVRVASTIDPAFLKEDGFSMLPSEVVTLPALDYNIAFCLYASSPVDVETVVDNNVDPTLFKEQTLLTITSKVGQLTIINTSEKKATVSVVRLGSANIPNPPVPDIIPNQLVTFSQLSRIAALPQAITTLANVRVQDVTLNDFENDQVTAPGTGSGVLDKFRICDNTGAATPTGAYIMLLDDNITQQNMSGTLQVWVRELG